ncbi:MAG: hypothetical protein RR541_09405 [Carnobacterium sp.]
MKAIFLGKFQPPHLGHVRTIIRLSTQYSSVIVGITQSEPAMMPFEEVKATLQEVLSAYKNIEVVLIAGSIEGCTATIDTLSFDVVISGNHKVLNILKEQGYQTKFCERTEGVGYSGSEIRSLAHVVTSDALSKEMALKGSVQLIPVADLKPLEKVLPAHFKNIEKMISDDRFIKKPLIVDQKFKVVLDGSHRYAFLLKYGFKFAPVIFIDYSDESIFVGNHLKHRYLRDNSFTINKSVVIEKALHEQLLDARTTRHFFPFRKEDFIVSLERLEQGKERNIDFLIQDIPIEKEIAIDEAYIKELDEEIEILQAYEDEQRGIKKYLTNQLKMMQEKSN